MVKRYLIGDKNSFAIEFTIENTQHNIMGHNILWLNNQYIGAWEDISILTLVLDSLYPMYLNQNDITDKDLNKILLDIENDTCTLDTLCIDDTYDDFEKRIFKQNDEFIFIWKLYKDSYFTYKNYDYDLKIARISIKKYDKVLLEFKKFLYRPVLPSK